MEIDDSDGLSVLNSDCLPALDSEESNKIRALLTAENDVAHDRAWHELPLEHRLKLHGVNYALCEPYRQKNAVKHAWFWEQGIELIRVTKGTDKYGKPLRNRTVWKCKYCNEVQFATANNKNKETHLDKKHGITKHGNKTPRPNLFRQTHPANTPVEPRENLRQSEAYVQLPVVVKSSFFQDALVAFVVLCHMAASLVESAVFIEFLTVLYPSLSQSRLLPARDTMRTWITSAFEVRKERMKTMLQKSKSKIHFSFDLWTSPNHLALLGIVAHFVDARAQNQSILIAIKQLKGAHSGENQAEAIIDVIKDYGIQENIGWFVTDNATNNDTAIDIVLAELCPDLTPEQRLGRRLRCLGHVINLAAKAYLFGAEIEEIEANGEAYRENSEVLKELRMWRKRGPVGKLHNIIVFICRTPQRREKFKNQPDLQHLSASGIGEFDHLNLIIDNATRWNSLYLMIERALKLRDRIERFCSDHQNEMHGSAKKRANSATDQASLLRNDKLESDDWMALAEVHHFLEPFYKLTLRAEGTKLEADRGVLSDYMTTLQLLLDHTRQSRDEFIARDENPETSSETIKFLRACAVNCWTKLDKYFSIVNDTPAHYASVVTVPYMKWVWFTTKWENAWMWKDAVAPHTWLPSGKRALNSLWDEYKNLPVPDAVEPRAGEKRPRIPDDFDRANDMTLLLNRPGLVDELELWNVQLPERLVGETLPQFWYKRIHNPSTYRLARMGLDMCSIPAMSSDCERVFSQCKLMITGQRNKLKADIIEATQCLRMWLILERKSKGQWWGQHNWKTPLELHNGAE